MKEFNGEILTQQREKRSKHANGQQTNVNEVSLNRGDFKHLDYDRGTVGC